MIRRPPIVGVPPLTMWLSGPSSRICLPKPTAAAGGCTAASGSRRARRRAAGPGSARRSRGADLADASTQARRRPLSATPREALTRTTSPARSRGASVVERASDRSGDRDDRVGRHARVARAARDPSAAPPDRRPRRPAGRTTPPRALRRPRGGPHRARRPARSISPRTATRRPGRPASSSSAAAHRARRGVVAVVDDRHAAGRTTSRPRCGADQPAARPGTISSSRHARRPARRRPPASALWTDEPTERGDRHGNTLAGRARERSRKRIPSMPAESHPIRAGRRHRRRTRRSRPAPPSAARMPPDARVVGVEDRRPPSAGRQRLDAARPWRPRSPRSMPIRDR